MAVDDWLLFPRTPGPADRQAGLDTSAISKIDASASANSSIGNLVCATKKAEAFRFWPSPARSEAVCDRDVEDTWHVSGLRATGSNDVVIKKPVFVPGHRYVNTTVRLEQADASRSGSYGAPHPSIAPWGVVVPVIGMAQGALQAFENAALTRVSSFGDRPVAQMAGPQFRISEASARIEGARALARSNIREAIDRGSAGESFSNEFRTRMRRDHAFVVNQCYEATMLIGRAAGASSLFESNPIQRFLRDVHAGSMQAAANWDEQAESYGRVRMGLEPNGALW